MKPRLLIKVKVSGEWVEVELIKTNAKTIIVKLGNGDIITTPELKILGN